MNISYNVVHHQDDSDQEEFHDNVHIDHLDDNDGTTSDQNVELNILEQKGNIVVGGGRFVVKRNNTLETSTEFNTSKMEEFRNLLSRLMYSKFYWIFYFCMIGLSCMLLLWNLYSGGHPRELWFIMLESFITFLLILEPFLRIILEGKAFFKSWLNWIDLFIISMCFLSFCLYIRSIHNSIEEELEELLDVLLILFRYVTQVLRIFLFIRNQRNKRKEQYIDLSTAPSAIIPMEEESASLIMTNSPRQEDHEETIQDDDDNNVT